MNEGYLAAYLTGDTLSENERREVEGMLQDPEVKREYAHLQQVVEQLAFAYGISPAEVVKQRLMENEAIMSQFRPMEQEKRSSSPWLMAASLSLAVLSGIAAFYFWNQWQDADLQLVRITAQNLQLAESHHLMRQELDQVRDDLAVIVSPEFSRIILNGTDNAPEAMAVIYWNAIEEQVFINSANLAALSEGQQYQLWALIDGQPVDAGVFDADAGRFQVMKNIAKADAFAVTVEQKGGSESPTLSTMQVFGKSS